MILTLLLVCLLNLALAYLVGKALRLRRPEIGALMLAAGFAETALIGLPMIKILFPENPAMIADAIVASEFGMVVPTLVLGPLIARIFGEAENTSAPGKLLGITLKEYVTSPIFIAVVIGMFVTATDMQIGEFFGDILHRTLYAATSGLTLLPLVLIGLILKPIAIRQAVPILIVALMMQTIVEPLVVTVLSREFALTVSEVDVMEILSMTPAALVAPVFALRYRCAPNLAAAITFGSMAAMIVMFPLMYYVLN
jgi:hypothetical protein